MSEKGFEQPGDRLLDEVRAVTAAESDPVKRLNMLRARIEGGDAEAVAEAVEAWRALPVEDSLLRDKPNQAPMVVTSLTNQGHFAEADSVIDEVWGISGYHATCAIRNVLDKGYAGPNDAYLHLDPAIFGEFDTPDPENDGIADTVDAAVEGVDFSDPYVWAKVKLREILNMGLRGPVGPEHTGVVPYEYITGLGLYGADFTDRSSLAGQLFDKFVERHPDPRMGQAWKRQILRAVTYQGHVDQAYKLNATVTDPFTAMEASMFIAERAFKQDHPAAESFFREALERLQSYNAVDPARREHLDEKRVQAVSATYAHLASIAAHRGDIPSVHTAMVHAIEQKFTMNGLNTWGASIYANLYLTTGNLGARSLALSMARRVGSTLSFAGSPVFEDIALADMRWQRVVPSLGDNDVLELVPLICDEVRQVVEHANLTDAPHPGLSGDTAALAAILFTSDEFLGKNVVRDVALARLASVMIALDAPVAAQKILSYITDPLERVRAATTIGVGLRSVAPTPLPAEQQEDAPVESLVAGEEGATIQEIIHSHIESLLVPAENGPVALERIEAALAALTFAVDASPNQNAIEAIAYLRIARSKTEDAIMPLRNAIAALRQYLRDIS